ncbi:hypothetical protein DR095_00215 [Mycoplasma flocculare]|uniref:Uncharacterized protein n=2 Tax=Mesomycoplasma flocculare TaxID=2128 RepID=A0AAW9XFS2_MESFC|nr:hypothetical protein [Mesomycoplasma flocculare]MXR39329.1 hypothetical protein [Mycoplasma sp. MF12]MXR05743.1 hypothetical protein [Mesomycoplasma flocculare]MXR12115.1 hypothetical protein [Mesomycoplasma flocculare]MXR13378.1 hypothetical protein [Mesomycoplasma flocculare]MXR55832.1 hypothetical protein [Mesomycoplasma flocculare]
MKKMFMLLASSSLLILNPFFIFSQKGPVLSNPLDLNFNFKELAKKLNFDKNLNQLNRNVKVGVLIEENGKDNNTNYNNLQSIFQFFSPNSELVVYRFKTKEQWLNGLKHFETVGIEMLLHLYKEERTFLNGLFQNGYDQIKFGDFLDLWSGKTGIISFFDGSKIPGDEINSNFSFFAKTDDRFKTNNQILSHTKIFGDGFGAVKSNHFIVPELKFSYQLSSHSSNIEFYSSFLLAALFSHLSSSFDSYESLKERNLKMMTALSLTASPSENSNLGFNGSHSNEGFGFINYRDAHSTLEQGNYLYNKFDGNEYTSNPFELRKGQKFSAIVFHDKFSEKEVKGEYLSGFMGFFYNISKNIRDSFSALFNGRPNFKLNDFDISIEIYRGGWQKIIDANSKISPYDKISFNAFENGQYRIKVSNVNFLINKPGKYFLAWRRYAPPQYNLD